MSKPLPFPKNYTKDRLGFHRTKDLKENIDYANQLTNNLEQSLKSKGFSVDNLPESRFYPHIDPKDKDGIVESRETLVNYTNVVVDEDKVYLPVRNKKEVFEQQVLNQYTKLYGKNNVISIEGTEELDNSEGLLNCDVQILEREN